MKNYYLKIVTLGSVVAMALWGSFAYAVFDRPVPPSVLQITSISPAFAKTGNNIDLTVNGAGFTKNSYIRIYEYNKPDIFIESPSVFISSNKLTLEIPSGLLVTGTHYVQVFNQNSNYDITEFSNLMTFTVTPQEKLSTN